MKPMPNPSMEQSQNQDAPLFIGLQSYNEAQSGMFFGRDEEIERLTTLVKVNALTIVFGRSGTGKTSLLNAGVFPPLRKNYCLPFRIRLEFQDNSPDLLTQIKNVLKSEIDKYGFRVENYPGSETLWEYFHKEFLWKSITPILVFDQFEEIFTLAKKNPNFANNKLENFWEELSDLIENKIPDSLTDQFLNHRDQITYNHKQQPVKVIFAFREEFLPEFESIPFKIPSLKYSRFRLMPMNENQAYDVITKTWGNKINNAQANKIITYMTSDEKLISISDIEPSLLSQVCFYLDKERIAQGNDKITSEFLDKYPKETILRSIYNEVLDESYDLVGRPPIEKGKASNENPVKVFVEDKLITTEGYRTKYSLTEYDENIRPGIEVLKTKYFVRDDGKSVELTHDVLTPIIKVDREKRRKKIAIAEANKKARRKAIAIILLAVLTGIAFWGFATYQRNIAQEEEAIAINHRDSLNTAIIHLKEDSVRLSNFTNKKEAFTNNHGNANNNPILPLDTTSQKILEEYQIDSAQIENLKAQYDKLNNQKNDLENTIGLQNGQITGFRVNQNKLDSINSITKRMINILNRQIYNDSLKIALLQNNLDALRKEFYQYKLDNPPRPRPVFQPDAWDLDSNSLKLKLYYGSSKKDHVEAPGNLTLYIIPDSSINRAIIRNAKLYEIRCDENTLYQAKGARTAKYSNGYYYFPNLPVGKYLIKICTYYGGYYHYTKKSPGTVKLNWDASPPIR